MSRYYAGIGSRETPEDVLALMTTIAAKLNTRGWTLRSGGADGADSAFETGAGPIAKEIHLPWRGYNGRQSQWSGPSPAAIEMASKYHPAWERCGQGARKLHGRNCHIALGFDLSTPVDLIICWTPNGLWTGGTGQALRMTEDYPDIQVVNLAKPEDRKRLGPYLFGDK